MFENPADLPFERAEVIDLDGPHIVLSVDVPEGWAAGLPRVETPARASAKLARDVLPTSIRDMIGKEVALYDADGMTGVCHLTQAAETEWKFEGDDHSPKGTLHRKALIRRTGPNELVSHLEDSLNGEKLPVVETTWTRKR